MYYLLYDPADPDTPFEIFYDNAPNSFTYSWFHPIEFNDSNFTLFNIPEASRLNVTNWCAEITGGQTYQLHQFASKPSLADVIGALNQHAELLI